VYKRHIERPQRPWIIWSYDVGKQLIGGFCVHFSNILVASGLGGGGDECAWYFINFFVDCTVGVGIVYLAHEAVCRAAIHAWGDRSALARIGVYGDPPDQVRWAKQLAAYLLALLVNKAVVAGCLYAARDAMNAFGDWLFGPLQAHADAELVVVMVLCPWLLMSLQFVLFDAFLKAPATQEGKKAEGGSLDQHVEALSPYAILDADLGAGGSHGFV
jgi:hypothetical protein